MCKYIEEFQYECEYVLNVIEDECGNTLETFEEPRTVFANYCHLRDEYYPLCGGCPDKIDG